MGLSAWHDRTAPKPFLATEICINDKEHHSDGYLLALAYGQTYHKLLTLTDAAWIGYCWTILNVEQPSYGMTRSLFKINRQNGFIPEPASAQLRAYGAYSRHIRRGMARINAASDDSNLLASAFKDENNRATLVLLNRDVTAAKVQLHWTGAGLPIMELTDPYHQNTVLDAPTQGAQPLVVPAGAIVTLSDVPLVSLPDDFQIP